MKFLYGKSPRECTVPILGSTQLKLDFPMKFHPKMDDSIQPAWETFFQAEAELGSISCWNFEQWPVAFLSFN